jgi:hypothetical protein
MASSTPSNYSILVTASLENEIRNETLIIESLNSVNDTIFSMTPSSPTVDNGTPSSRTFTFDIYLMNNPTNPFYKIDYGDGTPVVSGVYIGSQSSITLSHIYSKAGIYNAIVTVLNKVSTISQSFKVEISADYSGFKCVPWYYELATSNLIETKYNLNNNVYKIRKERDVRLYCSWTNDNTDAKSIQVNFDGVTDVYNDLTLLEPIQDPTLRGYILVIPKERFISVGSQYTVKVMISNSNFNKTTQLEIKVLSSVVGVVLLLDSTNNVIKTGSDTLYNVTYDSLGEPSCCLICLFLVIYKLKLFFFTFYVFKAFTTGRTIDNLGTVGTNKATCDLYYPTNQYVGDYNKDDVNMKLKFSRIYSTKGLTKINLDFKNELSPTTAINFNDDITISDTVYINPFVDIEDRRKDYFNPKVQKRSEQVALSGTVQFTGITSSKANTKKWTVYKVPPPLLNFNLYSTFLGQFNSFF